MPEVVLSAVRSEEGGDPLGQEPVPILRYDPEDPQSVARAQRILMRHFHLSSPPLICSKPAAGCLSLALARIKRLF